MVSASAPCKIRYQTGRIASSSFHVLRVFTCKRIKSRRNQLREEDYGSMDRASDLHMIHHACRDPG
jgi:hypothetical protein